MGKVKAIRLEDIEGPSYEGDGESSVAIFDAPSQLEPSDGQSTFDIGDVAGAERAAESVQDAAADTLAVYTSAPTHAPDPGKPVEPELVVVTTPTPAQSAEAAAVEQDEAPKRVRRTKAQIEADEKAEAAAKAADADSK